MHAAARFGFKVKIASPRAFAPASELIAWAKEQGAAIEVGDNPREAAKGTDCLVTDVWVSIGDGDEMKRKAALRPFQVDGALMALAAKDAIFMHCLPAHRGDEVTAEVIDGPQSVVWDEAENRLHVQKAILAWCLGAESRGSKAARTKRRKARGARK